MKRSILNNQHLNDQARLGNWPLAIVILIVGLVLTAVSTVLLKRDEEVHAKEEFTLVTNEIRNRIERRLSSHALLLRNGASFFAASDTVSRAEWKLFIKHSKLERNLPGIEGVGYSCVIHKDQLQDHIQKVRKEGFPDYTVKPDGDRDLYTSILYIEPFGGRNLRAFGYDMFSEPVRRKAMEQARDNDVAALTGKVILVQETEEHPQAGTLMYVPVYLHGKSIRTVEERRKAILGWVYSPYRMNDLMEGIIGRWDSIKSNNIRLQIFDTECIMEDSLLFDNRSPESISTNITYVTLARTVPLLFNGKKWILQFSKSERIIPYLTSKVLILFIAGVLISVLLSALFLAFSKAKSRMKVSEQLAMQLKESEEKHRALVENATEGIYVVQNRRIAYANKACESITGIPFHEMTGLPIKEFLNTDERDQLYKHHIELITGTTHSIHEVFPIDNRKEERRWLLINSVQINWNGSPATLNLATDVTERKEAEEEISNKNKELENLNATKDKFFSIIAHDLRSPFNSLLGLTELMVHDLPDLDRDQIQSMVESLHKSATNLYRLLENLLQWSQIQSGTMPFSPEPVQLRKIVDDIIEVAREGAVIKDIELVCAVNEHLVVLADTNMLQTVIRNLVSNAVKFTPKGGRVNVSALTADDNTIQIAVQDNGIGISPEMMANLFRIDVKVNRMGTESEPSNGIGLLLCKEFIEKHSGRIWVESEVGKGSTFLFTVPGLPKNA